jgi:hypothetical protein
MKNAASRQIEIITKAEAARRWGISAQAVSNYPSKGMPVRADGRLEWPAVDEWRKHYNVPERSGSFNSRNRPVETDAVVSSESAAMDRGAQWMAELLCVASRTAWPEFIATSVHMPGVPEELRLRLKAVMAGLMSHMLDGWVSSYIDLRRLPPIDFRSFGADSEVAAEEWGSLVSYLEERRAGESTI